MNNIEESTQKWQTEFDEEFRYSEGRDFQALMDDIKDFCAKQIATERLKFQEEARREIEEIKAVQTGEYPCNPNHKHHKPENWTWNRALKAAMSLPSLTPLPQEETR